MDRAVTPKSCPKSKRICNVPSPSSLHHIVTSTPAEMKGKGTSKKGLQFNEVPLGEKCRTVKIGNLPRPFVLLNFIKALEKFRKKHNIALEIYSVVQRSYDYRKETNTILVEFISVDIAEAMTSIRDMRYLNSTISFQHASQESSPDESAISPIPSGPVSKGNEASAVSTLDTSNVLNLTLDVSGQGTNNSLLSKSASALCGMIGGMDIDATSSQDVQLVEKTVNICGLREHKSDNLTSNNIDEDKHEYFSYDCDGIIDNVDCIDIDREEHVSHVTGQEAQTSTFLPPHTSTGKHDNTNCVKVTNIPADMEKDLLIQFVKAAMEEAELLSPEESLELVVKLRSSQCDDESIAILDFSSLDLAKRACTLDGLDCLGAVLNFEMLSEEENFLVMVINAPLGKEAFLQKYIEVALRRDIPDGGPIILNLFNQDGTVFMKVRDAVTFRKVVERAPLKFLKNYLEFIPFTSTSKPKAAQQSNLMPDKQQLVSATGDLADGASANTHMNGDVHVDGNPSASSTHVNEVINVDFLRSETSSAPLKDAKFLIKDDAGKVLFLKKLILTRRLFMNKQNFSAGHARLMGEVREAGVDVDMREVEKRRRYWQDIHNGIKRGQQHSPYASALAVIFDGAPVDILKDSDFEVDVNSEAPFMLTDPRKIAATAAMFNKGATFTVEASYYLLRVIRAHLDHLENAKNTDHFWREVSGLLASNGYFYDAATCEKQFLKGKKLYRDYVREQKRTGAASRSNDRSWFWNEDMHVVMEKDDIVRPPMTVSVGSSNIVEMQEPRSHAFKYHALLEEKEDDPESVPRIGRSRIPTLFRRKPKQDARTQAVSQLAAAVNRRTDVLLGMRSLQGNASKTDLVEDVDSPDTGSFAWRHT